MKPSATTKPDIRIESFGPQFAVDFERLNVEWLKRYFRVEPIDAMVLGDPQAHVIASGGAIVMAIVSDVAIGTAALKRKQHRTYELTKMAVTAAAQGSGAGRLLMAAILDAYRERSGKLLFLESHSSLKPAIALYESVGFVHAPRPFESEYQRSDVYMEWQDPGSGR